MLGPMSQPDTHAPPPSQAAPKRQLTLFDSTCIIVGIIIGALFYETTPNIAKCITGVVQRLDDTAPWLANLAAGNAVVGWLLSAPVLLIGVWVLGGLISLIGALCYAELATAYPKQGGDYVYLTRAFGRWVGFLFAWAQLWVVRPGSIGALAFVFGRYANELVPLAGVKEAADAAEGKAAGTVLGVDPLMIYAVGSIVVLTLVNMAGVRQGKWTQNLLTTVKVVGLAAVFVVGLFWQSPDAAGGLPAAVPDFLDFRLAMILILYTYGGWNEMAYVGAEVRNPRKNIFRSLVLGTLAVTAIYAVGNLAFIHALGFEGFCNSQAVATDVLGTVGDWGGRVISALICISALGAINGMVFTGARIYYAMGTEHRLYAWLGRWDERKGTPLPSLAIQAVITLALTVGFGWYEGGFDSLVYFTTPVFWIFFFLIGLTLFVLRWREPDVERPYRVPLYPVIPVLFCLSSLFMVHASLKYAWDNATYEAVWSIGILAVGLVMCFFDPEKEPGGESLSDEE